MSYIIVSVVSFAFGCIAAFFIGRNNQAALQAAYVKSLGVQAAIQKELDALKAKT